MRKLCFVWTELSCFIGKNKLHNSRTFVNACLYGTKPLRSGTYSICILKTRKGKTNVDYPRQEEKIYNGNKP